MRISINCRSFLKKQCTGIGRYASRLVQSLVELDAKNDYFLYVPKKLFDTKRRVPKIKTRNFHVKVDLFDQGPNKILKNIDVYHAPSPEFLNIKDTKIIVTVHDLIHRTYPQCHTEESIKTLDQQFEGIVEKASKIICCSQSTINDLQKYFPVDPSKVHLVYQGVDNQIFFPLVEQQKSDAWQIIRGKGIKEKFLLFVGTIEPRKNLDNVLRALSDLKKKGKFPGQLVVVGMKGWMCEHIHDFVKEMDLESDVVFLGYISDQELNSLYNLCQVFLFPSFYEGFGFPIVEAFSCGTAVITSNVSSCGEIAADAALKINPGEPQEIADGINRIIEDNEFKESLKAKALKRADDFSFNKTARETLQVYREACGK